MLSHYYDPYRSVPDVNKSIYYNYNQNSPPTSANYQQHNSSANQLVQSAQSNPKWLSQYQINAHASAQPVSKYLEREDSQDSYYSNKSNLLPSLSASPKKMLTQTSSFAENGLLPKAGGKSRSPQRIYKTSSDLSKEKKKNTKLILKEEAENLKKEKQIIDAPTKELSKKDLAKYDSRDGDALNQIFKKIQNIETNVLVANHKVMMMESRLESAIANQKIIIAKLDFVEKDIKSNYGLSPELLREIKEALNIDFDIDLEIKPDEKINKYSINSIKAYKTGGDLE